MVDKELEILSQADLDDLLCINEFIEQLKKNTKSLSKKRKRDPEKGHPTNSQDDFSLRR